jgi:hypothetical protein
MSTTEITLILVKQLNKHILDIMSNTKDGVDKYLEETAIKIKELCDKSQQK